MIVVKTVRLNQDFILDDGTRISIKKKDGRNSQLLVIIKRDGEIGKVQVADSIFDEHEVNGNK